MSKRKLLERLLISSAVLTSFAVEYFTFLQFGPLRWPLFFAVMLAPFLLTLLSTEYGVLLVLFLAPIINVFYYALNVRYSSLTAAVFVSAFLAWALKILAGRAELVRTPLDRPVAALGGATVLSLAILTFKLRGYVLGLATGSGGSGELAFSVLRTGFIVLCGCGAYFLFANNIKGGTERAVRVMLAACLVVGAVGLLEWVRGTKAFLLVPPVVRERTVPPPAMDPRLVISTFPNANLLGNYSLLLLGPALGSLLFERGRRKVLAGAALVFALFCLSFSGNRTGWFGAGFACAFGLWLAGREVRWRIGRISASVGLVLYFTYASLISTGLSREIRGKLEGLRMKVDVSNMVGVMAQVRLPLWRQALKDIPESPIFGIGPGTFPYFSEGKYHAEAVVRDPLGSGTPANPHNYYIWLLCETGTLGLGAFLWVLYRALKTGMERVRSAAGRWKFVYLGTVSSLAGYLLALTADHTLGFLEMQLVFWAVVGMLV